VEELDFIKENTEYDMNLKINEISLEERQRLLAIVEQERQKNYDEGILSLTILFIFNRI